MRSPSPPAAARGASDPPDSLESTGSSQLDLILGGGLPRGALTIILGPPGSGRTTLACQIAFAGAQRGQPAVVFTTLAEPPTKLLAHLSHYQFYVPEFIGEQVQVYPLKELLPVGETLSIHEVVKVVRTARARWVVVDDFHGLGEWAEDPRWARQLLSSLGTQLSLLGVTTLLTSEGAAHAPLPLPEMMTADVLLGLSFTLAGMRMHRELEVIRARGQAPLLGRHSLALSQRGVEVFPRMETRVTGAARQDQPPVAPSPGTPLERVTFGLHELDALLGGGFTPQTSTVLAGSLGTGKTLLALSFALAGVQHGESVLWLSFQETVEHLVRKVDSFAQGPAIRAALAPGGRLMVQHWDPVELDPDQVATELLAAVTRTGARRLIIDSLNELERAVVSTCGAERVPSYLTALLLVLRRQGVTVLALKETPKIIAAEFDFSTEPIAVVAQNILLLHQVVWREQVHRILSVLKMSFAAHETTLREVRIAAPTGFQVLARAEGEAEVLRELTRQQGTPAAGAAPALPETPPAG